MHSFVHPLHWMALARIFLSDISSLTRESVDENLLGYFNKAMKLDGFWKYLAERDKDTFVFGAIFALVIAGLTITNATAIYFVLTGCLAIIAYVLMRIALLRVQMMEREHQLKHFPARKARELIEANATKSEIAELEKLAQPVKTKRK